MINPPHGVWFITSSGTGIGKTFVAAAMAHQFRSTGRKALALKPIMTGWNQATATTSDAAVLLAALGREQTEAGIAGISPWRFDAPLSPHLAAEAEGRTINPDALYTYCTQAIADAGAEGASLIIEGIGGVMVPLTRRVTVLDWIEALSVPAILVVGSYLGALSHALSSASVLVGRGIAVAAVVVAESERSVGLEATAATLAAFLPETEIIVAPRVRSRDEPWRNAPPLSVIWQHPV